MSSSCSITWPRPPARPIRIHPRINPTSATLPSQGLTVSQQTTLTVNLAQKGFATWRASRRIAAPRLRLPTCLEPRSKVVFDYRIIRAPCLRGSSIDGGSYAKSPVSCPAFNDVRDRGVHEIQRNRGSRVFTRRFRGGQSRSQHGGQPCRERGGRYVQPDGLTGRLLIVLAVSTAWTTLRLKPKRGPRFPNRLAQPAQRLLPVAPSRHFSHPTTGRRRAAASATSARAKVAAR